MRFGKQPDGPIFLMAAVFLLTALSAGNVSGQYPKNLASLVALVDPSVVTLTMNNESQGSGFVIDAKGIIVTNYHVIEGAKWANITFSDKRIGMVDGFIAIDPSRDLALLHITIGRHHPTTGMKRPNLDDDSFIPHDLPGHNLPPGRMPDFDETNPGHGNRPPSGRTPRRMPGGHFTGDATKPPAVASPPEMNKEITPLRLADKLPAKGDRVFAFGSPMGLSGSVSDGIVAAIRSGNEVSETLLKLLQKDIYQKILGYTLDAQWIQTTAPISPGNSGGPLVNTRGEVVGINTWVYAVGQNLNFSLSASDLKQFLEMAGKNVQPLSNLPAPRPEREAMLLGNVENSLAFWGQLNKYRNELNENTAGLNKKLMLIVPQDPRNPAKGANARNKRCSVVLEQLAKAYSSYADNVKSLKTEGIDKDLIILSLIEGDTTQRMSDAYQQLSNAALTQSHGDQFWADVALSRLKNTDRDLRTARDVLRVKLSERYHKSFPSMAETVQSPDDDKGDAKSAESGDKDAGFRFWTDRTGRYQVQAKFLGLEEGKAKLEKTDGTIINIDIANLSEADQRFIGLDP